MVLAVVAGVGWAGAGFAQDPGAASGAAATGAGAAGAAKPGFFEKCCIKLGKCRRTLCGTPAGQMLNTMTRPASQMSGGIIPSFCPAMPTKEEQKDPGSKGAAAQGKADAADAKARVGAVQYLGTLDCHWFPEAEAGLVKALRMDRNECVRLAAAVALNRGCCCTKAILDALMDCVDGTEKFGPYENSPRVQNVALLALEKCLNCYHERPVEDVTGGGSHIEDKGKKEEKGLIPPPVPALPGEAKPVAPPPAPLPPTAAVSPALVPDTSARYSGPPTAEQVEHGKLIAARARGRGPIDAGQTTVFSAGNRDLYHVYRYVLDGAQTVPTSVATPATMVTQAPPMVATVAPPVAPTTSPVTTVKPAVPTVSPFSPVGTVKPAATRPAAPAPLPASVTPAVTMGAPRTMDPKVVRCLATLHNAEDPEVRHTAVKMLATVNWQENPEAVMALIHAARTDKHPGMRVACIRCLAGMKACTPEVMTGLKPMTADPDEWIRSETSQALSYLQTFMVSHRTEPAVLQVPVMRK
jgi:hypothetical protein